MSSSRLQLKYGSLLCKSGFPGGGIDPGGAVLIVGYDAQNIIYYRPGSNDLTKGGMNDSSSMFEEAGNVFYTCLP